MVATISPVAGSWRVTMPARVWLAQIDPNPALIKNVLPSVGTLSAAASAWAGSAVSQRAPARARRPLTRLASSAACPSACAAAAESPAVAASPALRHRRRRFVENGRDLVEPPAG